MIKYKVIDYFGINHKITHNSNLFGAVYLLIKLTYHLKITPFLFSSAFTRVYFLRLILI